MTQASSFSGTVFGMHQASRLLLVVLALSAACGPVDDDVGDEGSGRARGGDDDDVDDGVDDPVIDDDDPPPTPPTPAPEGWSAEESALLDLVNAFRAAGGACPSGPFAPLPPLSPDDALWQAARDHSEDMAAQDYFSHDGVDGSTFVGRIVDAGYGGQPFAENIAAGSGPEGTFEQWRLSDGHCLNMTTTRANEIGIGHASGGSWGSYWTQTFGSR